MYERSLSNTTHTRRLTIRSSGQSGWEVVYEQDSEVLKKVRYSDWHRVERARAVFALEAGRLCEDGWGDA